MALMQRWEARHQSKTEEVVQSLVQTLCPPHRWVRLQHDRHAFILLLTLGSAADFLFYTLRE